MARLNITSSGFKELDNELRQFQEKKLMAIQDKALKAGAHFFVNKLKSAYLPYKKTGAIINEITFSEPFGPLDKRNITIRWRGPKDRYRVIHLLEFGTIKNPNPKQKGVIQRTLAESQAEYKKIIKRELAKL